MQSIDVGARIAHWRRARKLTQWDLAKKIGVTQSAIHHWESEGDDRTQPSVANLEKVVKALGLTMERFYGRLPKVA